MRGRPRKFDENVALSRAAEAFRKHGYAATSMQVLSKAMGIREQSIYNAFGNKEAVSRKAIEHYCAGAEAAIATLESATACRDTIQKFFEGAVQHMQSDPLPCLLVQSAMSHTQQDCEVARQIEAQIKRLENAFLNAIRRAVERGEFACDDTRALAHYLNVTFQGINFMARKKQAPESLRAVVRQALAPLY